MTTCPERQISLKGFQVYFFTVTVTVTQLLRIPSACAVSCRVLYIFTFINTVLETSPFVGGNNIGRCQGGVKLTKRGTTKKGKI
jgi:hypothetical protein